MGKLTDEAQQAMLIVKAALQENPDVNPKVVHQQAMIQGVSITLAQIKWLITQEKLKEAK